MQGHANQHGRINNLSRNYICAFLQRSTSDESQLCATVESDSNWEDNLILLRQTISRLDRLKANRSWRGDDVEIEDAIREVQKEWLVE